METFKNFTLGLGVVIVILLTIALFLPSQFRVERSIVVNKPVDSVYPNVADLNNWLIWNPWLEMDSTVKNSIHGTGNEVGSAWAWEGEIIGTGSLTLQEIQENKSVKSKLVFLEPQAMESDDIWQFESVGEGTKVKWVMEGELDYPIGRFLGLFMDGMLGPDFEKGLSNLKEMVEQSKSTSI